jgi:hypothetical protein
VAGVETGRRERGSKTAPGLAAGRGGGWRASFAGTLSLMGHW